MLELFSLWGFTWLVFFGLMPSIYSFLDNDMQKGFDKRLLSDPVESGVLVSSALVSIISQFDESILEYSNRAARRSIENCCRTALSCVSRNQQRVSLLPELIPGFALLAFRLGDATDQEAISVKEQERNDASAAELVKSFMSGTGNRLISIKGKDVLMLIFPSEDIHKDLMELGVK